MNLNEIKEYTHPIRKINIYNKNRYSLRKKIVLKVDPQPQPNETVRFSLDKNDNFIGHQQRDKDYFIRVPNEYIGSGYDTNTTDNGNTAITTIYAHYFPKDLYEYEDDIQVFSEFDLYKIADLPYNSENYQIKFKNYNQNKIVSASYIKSKIKEMKDATTKETKEALEENLKQYKPIIQSLFDNNETKDPNYKNYYKIEGASYNETEQGMFPLSSRYRKTKNTLPYFYTESPDLNNINPKWNGSESKPLRNWEVKIHRDILSPLISDGVENTDEDTPLNVFLNYNYLPTSTEYHQHFYGFESGLNDTDYYNIFEGENINKINSYFGNDNNYRIIHSSNIYNDEYSIKVPKGRKIPINIDEMINENWKKNKCENYYICTGNTDLAIFNIEKDRMYSLKYYIYIPSKCYPKYDSCYISINGERISDRFLYQDKKMKNEWIYHEVPFIGKNNNIIEVVGSDDEEKIYFYDIYIEEFPQYSPTIKYNNRGIAILEEDQAIMRNITDKKDTQPSINSLNTWNRKEKNIPTPHTSVYFLTGTESTLVFDPYTKELNYIGENRINKNRETDKPLTINIDSLYNFNVEDNDIEINESENKVYTRDFNLEYDASSGKILIDNKNILKFTQGVNNHFEITILNDNNKPVTTGFIKCAIYDQQNFNDMKCDNISTPRGKCLDPGENVHTPDINGVVRYTHIDLSQLSLNNGEQDKNYFLRITYENECDNGEQTTEIKPFILEKERYEIFPMIRGQNINGIYNFNDNDLPLQIQALIKNQLSDIVPHGYCEIFIDDKLTQSTIVDSNGIADFYLDLEDLIPNKKQTIKILYYQKWDTPVGWATFEINNKCTGLPAVPIKIQALTYKQNNVNTTLKYENEYIYTNTISLDKGSPVFIDIDTENHTNFVIEIQAPNPNDNEIIEVREKKTDSIYYLNHLSDGIQEDETYYIITKKINNAGNEIPKYRENKVSINFKVID